MAEEGPLRTWIATAAATLLLGANLLGVTAQEQNVAIPIRDNVYDPPEITVPAGTTVTWTNLGVDLHTVTSVAGQFDSAGLMPGDMYAFTFAEPGEYRYLCMIHDNQDGIIRVVPA
jgi:plastocyanin